MLSIILPAYREQENLKILIPALSAAMKRGGLLHEIIVVDDNSQDGTVELVGRLSGRDPSIRLLERKGKLGLASAILDGAAISRGSALLIMDADLSHPPESAPKLCRRLDSCDIAVGSRTAPGGRVDCDWPAERRLISWGATLLARGVIGTRVSDPMSGFFAVKKDIFMRTRFRVRGYKILLNLLADNPGSRVCEVPYVFRNRHAGQTKLGLMEMLTYARDLIYVAAGRKRESRGRR